MRTRVTEMLGIEFPLLAFTHCRDVAAAVSAAGGLGVLGAVAHSPEQLAVDLKWIREQTGGKPFGVDLLIPRKYAGSNEGGLGVEDLRGMIPAEHRQWIDDLLERYGVPAMPDTEPETTRSGRGLAIDPKGMAPLIDIAFEHGIALFASALGSPPEWLVTRARNEGVPVAALAGRLDHAIAHRDAGVDLIIAQGTEGGGHTGEIATMVLVPQVVDAVAPIPVLAAGGIANGRPVAASLAKAYCSDTYFQCAADSLQIHGGVGFTWEYYVHLYFKRAKSSESLLGDGAYHRELVARHLSI